MSSTANELPGGPSPQHRHSDLLLMNGEAPRLDRCTSPHFLLGRSPLWQKKTEGKHRRGRQQRREIPAMNRRLRKSRCHDEYSTGDVVAAAIQNKDPHPDIHPPDSPSPSSSSSPPLPPLAMPPSTSASALLALASPATRRSISMGDFRRVTAALRTGSEPPSTSATAPTSKLVTPSSSMEFEAARRRLLEVEERQRVIREMERRLEELREVYVRSEQEVVVHGEVVSRISSAAQQGELHVVENSQRLKKGLKFKKHRPTIVFTSMLGLRTCLPWPVKLK